MTIEFCSYRAVMERVNAGSFTALISVLGNADRLEWPSVEVPHLCLPIDDIVSPMSGYRLASDSQISQLIRFGADHEDILVHCRAGSSRSPAVVLLVELQKNPNLVHSIDEYVQHFRDKYPFVRPNRRIVECGDNAFQLGGRLIAAVQSTFH